VGANLSPSQGKRERSSTSSRAACAGRQGALADVQTDERQAGNDEVV